MYFFKFLNLPFKGLITHRFMSIILIFTVRWFRSYYHSFERRVPRHRQTQGNIRSVPVHTLFHRWSGILLAGNLRLLKRENTEKKV